MGQSLTRNAVWDLIAPAVPDSLEDLGKGQYLAKWWKPVPMEDVELLVRNQGIKLHLEPFEPRDLPQGIAVLFSVVDAESPGHLAEHVSTAVNLGRARLSLRRTGS
jgi:hypothetical protein